MCFLHQGSVVFDLVRLLLYTGWFQMWRGRLKSLDAMELLVSHVV